MVDSTDGNQVASSAPEAMEKEGSGGSEEGDIFGEFPDAVVAEPGPAAAIVNGDKETSVGEATSVVSKDDEFLETAEVLSDPSGAADDTIENKHDIGDLLGMGDAEANKDVRERDAGSVSQGASPLEEGDEGNRALDNEEPQSASVAVHDTDEDVFSNFLDAASQGEETPIAESGNRNPIDLDSSANDGENRAACEFIEKSDADGDDRLSSEQPVREDSGSSDQSSHITFEDGNSVGDAASSSVSNEEQSAVEGSHGEVVPTTGATQNDSCLEEDNEIRSENEEVSNVVNGSSTAKRVDCGDVSSFEKGETAVSESLEPQIEEPTTSDSPPPATEENASDEIGYFNEAPTKYVEPVVDAYTTDSLLPKDVAETSENAVDCNEGLDSSVDVVSPAVEAADFGEFETVSEALPDTSASAKDPTKANVVVDTGASHVVTDEEDVLDVVTMKFFEEAVPKTSVPLEAPAGTEEQDIDPSSRAIEEDYFGTSNEAPSVEPEAEKEVEATSPLASDQVDVGYSGSFNEAAPDNSNAVEMTLEVVGSSSSSPQPTAEDGDFGSFSKPKECIDATGDSTGTTSTSNAKELEDYVDTTDSKLPYSDSVAVTSEENVHCNEGLDSSDDLFAPAVEEADFGDFGTVIAAAPEISEPTKDLSEGHAVATGISHSATKADELVDVGAVTEAVPQNPNLGEDVAEGCRAQHDSGSVPTNISNDDLRAATDIPQLTTEDDGFGDFGSFDIAKPNTSTPTEAGAGTDKHDIDPSSRAIEDDEFGDFGSFNEAPSAEQNTEKKIEGTSPLASVQEDVGEFGSFNEADPEKTNLPEETPNVVGTSASSPPPTSEDDEFGDFGSFTEPKECIGATGDSEGMTETSIAAPLPGSDPGAANALEDDDDFGDFTAAVASHETSTNEGKMAEESTLDLLPADQDVPSMASGDALTKKVELVFAGVFARYDGDTKTDDDGTGERTDERVCVKSVLVSISLRANIFCLPSLYLSLKSTL